MFRSAAEEFAPEWAIRQKGIKTLRFGIEYLDDATRGILPDDLVVMSAASGAGKSQLCVNLAIANLEDEKTVHYIALEAGKHEVTRRLRFSAVADRYFSDPARPRLNGKFNFTDWYLGRYAEDLRSYEEEAEKFCTTAYKKLMLYEIGDKFGVNELVESVVSSADAADLIMIDHYHYFDLDSANENAAAKEIAKCLRDLIRTEGKPIVLVAHLRKSDGQNTDLVPSMEEIHGGSDIYKIASKVITLAPGRPTAEGSMETYFRICKNRLEGSVNRYCGQEFFSPKLGGYEKGKYKVGWADCKRRTGFAEIAAQLLPHWARAQDGGGNNFAPPGTKTVTAVRNWATDL